MLLHDAVWAPSPRRVRVFLAEKGVALDRRLVDLRANEQLEPAFLAVNPRGTVPALEVPQAGVVLTESGAICRYVEALHPDPPLFGRTPIGIALVDEWTRRIEGEGYAAAVYALRNTNPAFADRGAPGRWPAVPQIPALAERARTLWAGFAAALDARLTGREWIAEDGFSFADVTALVTVDFARAAGLRVPAACAAVADWHARAGARPSAAA